MINFPGPVHDPLDRDNLEITKQSEEDALDLARCYWKQDVDGARELLGQLRKYRPDDYLAVWVQLDSKVRTWLKKVRDDL